MRSGKKESLADRLFAKLKPESRKPVAAEEEEEVEEASPVEETVSEQEEFETINQETSPFEDDTSSSSSSSASSSSPSSPSTSENTEFVAEFKDDEKATAESASIGSPGLNNKLLDKFNEKLESGKEKILGASEIAAEDFVSAIQNIENKKENVVEGKERFLEEATALKGETAAAIKDKGEGIAAELVDAKESVFDAVSNGIKSKENLIGEVVDAKKEAFDGAQNVIKNKENLIGEAFEAKKQVLDGAINIGENIANGVKDKVEKVVGLVKEKEAKILDKIAEEKEDALKKASDIVEKVEDVKEEVIEEVEDTVTKIKGKKKGYKRPKYRRPLYRPYQQSYYRDVSPLKCYSKILDLEVTIVEISNLLEKLKNKLYSTNYQAYETRGILYQLTVIKRAIEDFLYAIKSDYSKLLGAKVRKIGRELTRLSTKSIAIELEPSLPSAVSKLRRKYNKLRKTCRSAY